ncbi:MULTISPECIES: YqiA/YcfP family alpha/beta fold hydrolase [Okeania]|uniref:Alpha/beta fold hydrolase n=1 Tax=Okeania hirsuta TaxID=1458930 RepID=A0A3N6P3L7_9CYAN|nr:MULTISPECIES: YqiA/YcfP family alpha/beta fold hydrolase [Okeania]NES89663.1 alpha/beta fold hydrolase [Okeania sp. SIO2B9]NET78822.1 alpha/beta fold hydrolase [Okeania sp. SIO1F9]RQH16818.1 alpha/beta fold hydrolase [Okeania hirsuta]RQH40946.1 alpha/beta fold hydrolase [Okeania hirsuta]
MLNNYTYIYLHGFASSPKSNKAIYLRDRFAEINLNLNILDLNQNDFYNLTLTRQIHQVESEITKKSTPIILIGSSFGGLTSTFLAEQNFHVKAIILLAPAFNFLSHWQQNLGEENLQKWQERGDYWIYHYGEKKYSLLSYDFIVDLIEYEEKKLKRTLPTLIFHGLNDNVIPIQASREFVAKRSWVELIELDTDHTLGNVMAKVWQEINQFLKQDFS